MDRIEAMGLFVQIADAGSLAAAGRRLRQPLQSVSRKLQALEDHLGVRLLTRTTRRLALTEAGRDYLEACRRIGVAPSRSVAIEDSANGARAAKAAGMTVVLVPLVGAPSSAGAEAVADVIVASLDELPLLPRN